METFKKKRKCTAFHDQLLGGQDPFSALVGILAMQVMGEGLIQRL